MPNYKLTYIFAGGQQGWSETWYFTASDIITAHLRALDLRAPRQACLGVGSTMQAIRTSNVDVLNDSKVSFFGADQTVFAATRDTIGAAVLLRIEATDKSRRMFWLRGIPDSWIDIDPVTGANKIVAGGATISGLTAALAKPPAFQLFAYDKSGQGSTGVAASGPIVASGAYTLIPVANLTAVVGNPVLMRKWKGPDAAILNRTYNVVAVTNLSVTIDLLFADLTDAAHDFAGMIYPRNKGFIDVTNGFYERSGIRKAGRAFFVPRGRRRAPR